MRGMQSLLHHAVIGEITLSMKRKIRQTHSAHRCLPGAVRKRESRFLRIKS